MYALMNTLNQSYRSRAMTRKHAKFIRSRSRMTNRGSRYIIKHIVLLLLILVFSLTSVQPVKWVYGDTLEYGYQGAEGSVAGGKDYNSIKLINPSDISVISKTDEGFINQINDIFDGNGVIEFSFRMSAGQNAYNEDKFKKNSMPEIMIYNEDESSVIANYNEGSGLLKYLGGQSNTGQNEENGWIKIGLAANILDPGEYVLYFGPNIAGNNTDKILGMWLKFKFTVTGLTLEDTLGQAEKLINIDDICDDGAYTWGKYPQSSATVLQDAVNTAKDSLGSGEEIEKAATLVLLDAIKTFKLSRYVKIDSINIVDEPTEVSVGDSGRFNATVVTLPDEVQYQKIKWTASDNISIDEDTGVWQANYGGNATVRATALTTTSGQARNEYDEYNFSVSAYDKYGMLCVNLPSSGERLDKLLTNTGENLADIEKLRITASVVNPLTGSELKNLKSKLTGLKKLDIKGAGIKSILSGTFENYITLEEIVLPKDTTSIGLRAFSGCTNLSKIDLPAAVTSIGTLAFENCTSLPGEIIVKSTNPPEMTASRETGPFVGTNVTGAVVPYKCKSDYEKSDSWSGFTFRELPEVKLIVDVNEPGTLEQVAVSKMIGQGLADYDINTLVITTSGDGRLTRNEDHAYLKDNFYYASTIDMGGAETQDHKCNANYFKDRISLKKMILPFDTETIGASAFSGCTSLQEIKLPSKLVKIGSAAFSGCNALNNSIVCDALEPPEYDGSPFDPDVVDTFIVPVQSVNKYKVAEHWMNFTILPQITISLDRALATLGVTHTINLVAKVKTYSGNNPRVEWTSSHPNIASVNKNTGNVTGIRQGTAVITATTIEGGAKASCFINVEAAEAPRVKVVSTTYNKAKISWTSVGEASGYEVYRSTKKNSGYTKIQSFSAFTRTYSDNGIKTGTKFYYKVRAYKDKNNVRYAGNFSSPVSVTPGLKKPTLIKAKRSGKNKIKLSWKKVSGANGYVVYRSTKKKSGFKKVKIVKGRTLKFVNKKLKKGKRYYYKVKAYRVVNGKKFYSPYSKVVSNKAK